MLSVMRVASCLLLGASAAGAPLLLQDRPSPILPDALSWSGPPDNPRLTSAWLVGAETQPGLYAVRVRLAKGGTILPHTHTDTRYSTVLSGTLYAGFGETTGDAALVAIPAGGVYVVPAGVAHYISARDGDVTYQEGGVGPTSTVPIGPAAR